ETAELEPDSNLPHAFFLPNAGLQIGRDHCSRKEGIGERNLDNPILNGHGDVGASEGFGVERPKLLAMQAHAHALSGRLEVERTEPDTLPRRARLCWRRA